MKHRIHNARLYLINKEIKEIIKTEIICDQKTENYSKLENRIIQEIISNVNIDDIEILEEEFKREEQSDSWFYSKPNPTIINTDKTPECELRKERVLLGFDSVPKPNHASYSVEDIKGLEDDEIDVPQRLSVRSQNPRGEISIDDESQPEDNIPEEFLDLQMAVEEDVSHWNRAYKNNDVIVYKKKTEGTPLVLIKAIATLRGFTKDIVFEAIYDTDVRQSWDKVFDKFEVVEETEDHTVLYYVIKAPIGISNRDFLQSRTVRYDWPKKGVTYMHFKSIDHPQKPPVKKIIRAETIMSGYIFEQIQDDPPITKLIIISQNDIKGLIPKYLVNLASGKAPKQWIANLISGWKKLKDNKNSS